MAPLVMNNLTVSLKSLLNYNVCVYTLCYEYFPLIYLFFLFKFMDIKPFVKVYVWTVWFSFSISYGHYQVGFYSLFTVVPTLCPHDGFHHCVHSAVRYCILLPYLHIQAYFWHQDVLIVLIPLSTLSICIVTL